MQPGWNLVLPIFESYKKIDIRTKVVDVPEQDVITKDNVSVRINAVIYYKIFDASKAILEVENFYYAVSQLAQTTMRNVVGSVSLNELLGEREKISVEICKIIDEATDPWGIKVENVELKDVSLPEEMKRVIAKVAEAEREKEAEIVAILEGKVIGTAGVDPVGRGMKISHRAEFGVSILKAYWGLGIGRALSEASIECAKRAGYSQLELQVVSDNLRAIALYRDLGFNEYGRNPRGFRTKDGSWQQLILMRMELD